jgi:DNA-binding MarR family transcriptional regulator
MLGIDPSTASRNLAGLERAGFITRKKGSDDGRQTDIRLSPRGKRTADAVSGEAQQAYAGLVDKIPRADRAKVIEALDILAKAMDGGEAPSA